MKQYQRLCLLMLVVVFFLLFRAETYLGGRNIFIQNPNFAKLISSSVQEQETDPQSMPQSSLPLSPLTGLPCECVNQRPMAIMLAGDTEARPLSGISEAEVVIEMPVVTSGITRYLAIFHCSNPQEIGSVRSARHDFISLAAGFDAIFVHWGGSHFALDKLKNKVVDNINALYLDGSVFYRKVGLVAPHDGFSTLTKLKTYSQEVQYRNDWNFVGYKFAKKEDNFIKSGHLTIKYPNNFKVDYEYDGNNKTYTRFKADSRELDRNNNQTVTVSNVIVVYAVSRQIEGQYNDVDIDGEGKAVFYFNGSEVFGVWKKDKNNINAKMLFFDDSGNEIEFMPGKTWIQVVQPNQTVRWQGTL